VPSRLKTLTAFGIIYFVWGSTFFAIRVGVLEIAPLLLAAIRFSVAGAVMSAWALARGERLPSRRQWGSIALLAFLIFLLDYGLLFSAERRVASGMAAVILATIPAFTAIGEIIWLRTQRLTLRLAAALLVGLGGVVVLVDPSLGVAGAPVYGRGAVFLVVAAMSWSGASILMRVLPLPGSKIMSAGAQMLVGGGLLAAATVILGEEHGFHPAAISAAAWLALAYLIVAGSLLGFGAYIWLIHHQSPTRVGTYAYVNPLVAVVIGYLFGGEPLDARTVLGTVLVIVSVAIIITGKTHSSGARAPLESTLGIERS
jgi:drug/metabolite transporter (DMT)-like permease